MGCAHAVKYDGEGNFEGVLKKKGMDRMDNMDGMDEGIDLRLQKGDMDGMD